MALSLIGWGVFSLIFLMIIGFVSNLNPTSQSIIAVQNARLACPMPDSSGLHGIGLDSSGNSILFHTNGTYNYPNVNNKTKTLTVGGIICTGVHTLDTVDYFYGTGAGVAGAGVVFFIGDYFSELVDKVGALLTLFVLYITPINFTMFGFTLSSLSPMAQMMVFTLYAFCYTGIGAMIYKLIDPFAGG